MLRRANPPVAKECPARCTQAVLFWNDNLSPVCGLGVKTFIFPYAPSLRIRELEDEERSER